MLLLAVYVDTETLEETNQALEEVEKWLVLSPWVSDVELREVFDDD